MGEGENGKAILVRDGGGSTTWERMSYLYATASDIQAKPTRVSGGFDFLVGHTLTSSRLDYANSVLYGSPKYSIKTLQRVQNTLARVVLQSDRSIPSASLLQQLHWLPVD